MAVLIAATLYWYVSDGKPRTELRRAAEIGDVAAMEDAIDRGADVDGMDVFDGGSTPLIAAVRSGQVQAVKYLLKAGADPNLALPDRRTALKEATGHDEVKVLLIAAGATETPSGRGLAGHESERGLASEPKHDNK
jgi:ankyrin repeat protein